MDPITVVVVNAATYGALDFHWTYHLPRWSESSTEVSQSAVDINNACAGMGFERAEDGSERRHARMLEYGFAGGEADAESRGYHIHASPHYDAISYHPGCGFYGHVVPDGGFQETRNVVTAGFRYGPDLGITPWQYRHPHIKRERWGNTRPMEQCNGDEVRSDGYADYIDNNHFTSPPPDETTN